jgi:DNA-binding NtrC family response regulator
MQSILIVHGHEQVVLDIKNTISNEFLVKNVSTLESCFKSISHNMIDLVFIDLELVSPQSMDNNVDYYPTLLKKFWQVSPSIQIVIITSQEKIREAVKVLKAGANEYVTFPIIKSEISYIIENSSNSVNLQQELDYLRDRFWQNESLEIIRTNSPQMQKTFEKIKYVAKTKATILLTGETGVGKGVIAKLIHRHSDRCDNPFVHVHCGAIVDNLFESELFGHEKGSFTGAFKRKLGRFEIAANGTIFLDEIGTVSSSTQVKLLQVLQDKIFQRVGGEIDVESDARVIAATNIDLKKMVEKGDFRSDLYYRLNVFPIEIPPLRERKDDIPLLIHFFLKKFNKINNKEIVEIHPLVEEASKEYAWPGNIRELENIVERAFILENSSILTPESFPQELLEFDTMDAIIPLNTTMTLAETRSRSVEQVERQYLKEQLLTHKGRINKTAAAAGITTRQLHKLMTKYKILKKQYRS